MILWKIVKKKKIRKKGKNSESLIHAVLSIVDTFMTPYHYTISKKAHLLISTLISSETSLRTGICHSYSDGYKFSNIHFYLKAQILSLETNTHFIWNDRLTWFIFEKNTCQISKSEKPWLGGFLSSTMGVPWKWFVLQLK